MLTNFSNSFTGTFWIQFGTTWLLKYLTTP